jgi:hypothetical protein
MRAQHPNFDRRVPPDAALWRYLDFREFVSLLKEEALYFCRVSSAIHWKTRSLEPANSSGRFFAIT